PVAFEKNVIVIAQGNLPLGRLVRHERIRMFVTREITATPDLHRNRQLVAVQRARVLTWLWSSLRLPRVRLRVFRINVNQLDDEVAIGARSSGDELCLDF